MKKFILFFAILSLAISQDSSKFNAALKTYNSKNYKKAIDEFKALIATKEKDIAYVMLMMSHYGNKEYVTVKRVFSDFMQNTPSNMYLDEAYYVQGKALFQLKDTRKAIEFWLLAFENTKNNDVTKKVGDLIKIALINMNSEDEFNHFLSTSKGERSEVLLSSMSAEFFEKNNKFSSAKNVLNDFVAKYPTSAYSPVFSARIKKLTAKISNKVYIGLLLPLESAPEVSNEIKSGIEFSISEFEKKSDFQVELRIEDCGESVLDAIKAARKIAEDKSIIAMIGPLMSDQASAVALIANQHNIPIIAPTASEHGIVDISKYIYQMWTDNFTLGKLIAEHAYGELKFRSFAVLSASSGKSFEVASGFSETINRLGGEIVAHQQYLSDQAANTPGQFRAIRNLGIKKAFRDSIEAADPLITTFQLDSIYDERLKIGAQLMVETGEEVDSSKMLVEAIDAIFFPISVSDDERIAKNIISNFAVNNFKTHLIGTGDWFDPQLFEQNRNYARAMDSMYVFTPIFIDKNSTEGQDFENAYFMSQKVIPGQYHFIGYRSSQFLFSALNAKNLNRSGLQLNLSNKDGLIVIGNQINFDHKERVNSGTTVLQLKNGKFKKIN